MGRSVSVKLLLDVIQYKRAAKDAERSTKGIADSLVDAAKAGDDTATATNAASRAMQRHSDAAKNLDRDIDGLRGSLKELATSYSLAGDAAGKLDISKQIRAQQTELRKALNARKLLGDLASDIAKEGERAGSTYAHRVGSVITTKLARLGEPIGSALSASFSSMPPQAQAAVGAAMVGLVVAAAPLAGAAAAAALIGGAGTGGIVGGLVLASKDARVRAEAQGLGSAVGGMLGQASQSFVPATLNALGKVRAEFVSWDPMLRGIFDAASRYLDPLTDGALGFIRNFLPGLLKAVEAGEPFFDMLADELPELGADVGELFATAAKYADEAASAAGVLLDSFGFLVDTVSSVVMGLSEVYGGIVQIKDLAFGDDMEYSFKRLPGPIGLVAAAFDASTAKLGAAKIAADAETASLTLLREEMERIADTNLTAAEASLNYRDAVKQATDAADGHKKVSGEEERQLLNLARSSNTLTGALEKQGASTGELSKHTETARAKFIAAAEKMGYTRTQAEQLAAKYLKIPPAVSTKFKVPGLTSADRQAGGLEARMNRMDGRVITMTFVYGDVGGTKARHNRWGGIYEHAESGLINLRQAGVYSPMGPARYAFAEPATGGEAFIPKNGDPARSLSILDQAASWYGKTLASRAPMYMGGGGGGGRSSGGGGINHFHFHGPVGSSMELENWLTRAVDSLRRKGRM